MASQTKTPLSNLSRNLPYILIVGGIIALICSFIIMLDKIDLLTNPHFQPNCDLNPVISCGSVMSSKQGAEFGFPNPIIGLAAFPVIITVGVSLLAGAAFKRWFWLGLNAGLGLAVLFIHWLAFESVYKIHALCPYCMVVWVMVITMFWYVSLYNIGQGNLKLPASWQGASLFVRRHHLDLLVLWFLIMAFLILHHFWYYYGSHL